MSHENRVSVSGVFFGLNPAGADHRYRGDPYPTRFTPLDGHYLKKRGLIQSAEQFIDRAASESSMSRRAYTVKCGDAEPIASSVWFMNELQAFRKRIARERLD